MKSVICTTLSIEKSVKTFQNTEASEALELHEIASEKAGTKISDKEIKDGILAITIAESEKADEVIKHLKVMGFDSEILSREQFLLDRKKRREEERKKAA